MSNSNEPIRDAKQLGTGKVLVLGLQHMFAMFGATILVPILVNGYFAEVCGEKNYAKKSKFKNFFNKK